ncbi:Mitotic spindle-associated MMXD complex subunit MIP18 [Perkinsus olseni]|uniref:Mitotic spindle-associated MMXD complex subunit MIP18 n=1 Tax=Perkinsus olseni TaxID=32597 RepID=A0A7J6TPY4_PEROL|nr:Mitotic spindle-associated MMXD complex subunit MIP18 [Perkinsus olseni]
MWACREELMFSISWPNSAVEIFGTHDQEEQVNKQLNDKERCQAAIENPNLQKVIRQGIFESDPPLPDDLQLIPVS